MNAGRPSDVSIVIRPEKRGDERAVNELNQAAFGAKTEAELVDALRQGGHVAVSLVAEYAGRILGHILFSNVAIASHAGRLDALALAPMAVLPEYQRQGIGSRLVIAGLKASQRAGHEIVLVLGHPRFYPRFGFSTELAEKLSSAFGGGEAWMAIELTPGALAGVVGHVEYPRPFERI